MRERERERGRAYTIRQANAPTTSNFDLISICKLQTTYALVTIRFPSIRQSKAVIYAQRANCQTSAQNAHPTSFSLPSPPLKFPPNPESSRKNLETLTELEQFPPSSLHGSPLPHLTPSRIIEVISQTTSATTPPHITR